MKSIITPVAILSYPAIWEPRASQDDPTPKYSASFVFPANTDLTELRAAVTEAGREKFGDKYEGLLKANKLRLPFRDDGDEKGYEKGSIYFNAKNKMAPGVVSRYAGSDGKPAPIVDPKEIYAGVQVRASVRAFGYDTKGNRGIAFSLQNLQKWDDGKRLDGRKAAQDEFDAEEGSDLV